MGRPRNRWGWGFADAAIAGDEARAAAAGLVDLLGFGDTALEEPADFGAATLPAPRVACPPALRPFASVSDEDRARHSLGSSYMDLIRGLRARYEHAVDLVARPLDEAGVEAVLDWAQEAGVAVIPYGGGTSVVGGIEPRIPDRFAGSVSLDLGALHRVLEVDEVSRAARIAAGACGPVLEEQLRSRGMTMRFFPQSFELSTLGGWIATRAGGHFATGPTHVDDLVESIRAITPTGRWRSRRLPGSGAGPSPDRLLLGSEGTLGVITEAWVRVQPRPDHRASRTVRFDGFLTGAQAVRAIVQAGLRPANCRLLDPREALMSGARPSGDAVLVLGFESTDHAVDHDLDRALALSREHGGRPDPPASGADAAWRQAFLRMPYVRDLLVRAAVLVDTFETAVTWERLPALHHQVMAAARAALGEPCHVSCRLTHVYSDGAAPYFTVLAPVRRGEEEVRWQAMKDAVSRAILAAGGTITHHHAVGRDHRPYYEAQRPDPFAAALAAAKAAVDPLGVLNPGVLFEA